MNAILRARSFVTLFRVIKPKETQQIIFPVQSTIRRQASTAFQQLEQSNTIKDVILFKYENPKFYRYLNIFAVVQFLFWSFVGRFSIESMRDVPVAENVSEEEPWWKRVNLGEGKYKHSLAIICYVFGCSILACSWIYTLRNVRFLILHKGGNAVSLVTYTPLGPNRILKVPLDKISCSVSRASAKATLPIKVQNQRFHYLLDMRGEFRNPQLFDITAGVQRKL